MDIFRAGLRPSRLGPAAYFTGGQVIIDELIAPTAPARAHLARVSFPPGARTAWHSHPVGQSLHVLSGVCLLQQDGQPAQWLSPGDTAWIPPGIRHWHGASAANAMVHLAMHEADEGGSTVTWLEPVSDADYAAANAA